MAERERFKPDIARGIATLLGRIEGGESERYWSLDSLLGTTEGNARTLEADVRRLPAWKQADEATRSRILSAALTYVLRDNDHGSEGWLGTNTVDWRALAGFRALFLLWGESRETITNINNDVWNRWAAAIVGCAYSVEGESHCVVQHLFCLAYQNAPDQVIAALDTQIGFEIENGFVSVIEYLAKCWDDLLEQRVLAYVLDPLTPAGCVDQLLRELYKYRPEGTVSVLRGLVHTSVPITDGHRERITIASRLLLSHSPAYWPFVYQAMQSDVSFARTLVEDITVHGGHAIANLGEDALADLYIWLVIRYPYDEDPDQLGVHFVSLREQIGNLRNTVLQLLINRETVAAYEAIRRIAGSLPDLPWLRRYLRDAEFKVLSHTWKPLFPEDLVTYFMDARSRIVRNAEQLMGVILESLQRLDTKMRTGTPLAQFLWYRKGDGGWHPQDESYLSDLI